jgi:hypothetical protein
MYQSCDIPIDYEFYMEQKKYTFRGQKGDREICMEQEKYDFRVQLGENKPSAPLIGISAPKSLGSCDISIDRDFHMVQEKI